MIEDPSVRPRPLIASALRALAAMLLASTSLAACSRGEQEAAPDSATAATAGAPDAAAEGGASTGSIQLEVVGGPHAGTYNTQMTSGGCSYGLAGEGAWGNQYSVDTSDPKAFSSLQLIVPDSKAAAGGTTAFRMTANFGPLFGAGATSYDIDTRSAADNRRGSGRVTVDDRGNTGRVTFDAKTEAGVGLKGTIDCTTVMRAG